MSSCCPPARPGAEPPDRAPVAVGDARLDGMVELPGGTFSMGTDDPDGFPEDHEGPVREVSVESFAVAAHGVSNQRFTGFVGATGYESCNSLRPAKRCRHFGWRQAERCRAGSRRCGPNCCTRANARG